PITVTLDVSAPPGPVTLVVRPEAIAIRPARSEPTPPGTLSGRVERAAYLGGAGEYLVATEVGALAVTDALMADDLLAPGPRVWLTFARRGLAVLPEASA